MKIVFAAMFVICGCNLIASPIDDLASPSQQTRDAAAKIQRATYVPSSKTNWNALLDQIKIGDNKTNVIEMLRRLNIKSGGGAGTGTYEVWQFRLDDSWCIGLYSERDKVTGRELLDCMRDVWVLPPTNYSGLWTTYWVNGQKHLEVNVQNGKYLGEFTGFYTNGSKAYVQHFINHVAEGEDTGYFPSGKVSYRGQYKTNAQVGTWIWFNEDGSTNSVEDFSTH